MEYNTSLLDGTYTYNVSINDTSGSLAITSLNNITLDNTLPTINFDSQTPANNTYSNDRWLYFNWIIIENNINTIIVSILNDTDVINYTEYVGILQLEYNTSLVEEIAYYYNISINDTAGNINNIELRTYTLDITPPVLLLAYPINNTWEENSELDINFSATDNILLDACWYFVENKTGDLKVSNTTFTNCDNATKTTGVGEIDLYVYINDSAGNIDFAIHNLTVATDISNPIMTVSNPVNDSTQTSKIITITLVTTDNENVDICWFNLTKIGSGDLEGNDFRSVNCNGDTIFTTDFETNYALHLFVNDTSNNIASSEIIFVVSIPVGNLGGGGGGGDEEDKELICGTKGISWIARNSKFTSQEDFLIYPGQTRKSSIQLINNGTEFISLTLKCQEGNIVGSKIEGVNVCEYITLSRSIIELVPQAQQIYTSEATISLPKNAQFDEEGKLYYSILVSDNKGACSGLLSYTLNKSVLGKVFIPFFGIPLIAIIIPIWFLSAFMIGIPLRKIPAVNVLIPMIVATLISIAIIYIV